MNALADVFKAVGLTLPPTSDGSGGTGSVNIIRPMCCLMRSMPGKGAQKGTRNIDATAQGGPRPLDEFPEFGGDWHKPKKIAKMMRRHDKGKERKCKPMPLSAFLRMKIED